MTKSLLKVQFVLMSIEGMSSNLIQRFLQKWHDKSLVAIFSTIHFLTCKLNPSKLGFDLTFFSVHHTNLFLEISSKRGYQKCIFEFLAGRSLFLQTVTNKDNFVKICCG